MYVRGKTRCGHDTGITAFGALRSRGGLGTPDRPEYSRRREKTVGYHTGSDFNFNHRRWRESGPEIDRGFWLDCLL